MIQDEPGVAGSHRDQPSTRRGRTMKLHYFPLSTYSQKALIALHEKGVAFEPTFTNLTTQEGRDAYRKVYPLGKVPLLELAGGHIIPEATIIIEYIDTHFDGPRLIPADTELARRTRFLDRVADNYVNDPFRTIFFDTRKPEAEREPKRVASA